MHDAGYTMQDASFINNYGREVTEIWQTHYLKYKVMDRASGMTTSDVD